MDNICHDIFKIFCNTRKSVTLTAEALSRELTITFNAQQRTKLTALASTIKNKKLQSLILSGVGCHHAGLLYEERFNIEHAFRNRDLPILITTTTLAMGVNLPAHLVIIKNTQQYVNGAYQEYSISTVLQMVGRAGRPQFDTEATAVIMTRAADKPRYQSLVYGSEPLQSYLHKRLPENLNSEAALGTVNDVAQCVQWLRSTFLYVRAAGDPKRYLGLPVNAPHHLISKKIEELCVRAMNGLATAGLITMDEASCIESTEAGRLMSIYYLDLETMKQIMKINGTESLESLLCLLCESHELSDMHLRVDERRCLNALNRNNAATTIRYPMKGKISTRQMKVNCLIQATLGCLAIPDPSLNQEAMKVMRIAERVCKCLVAYVIRPDLISGQPNFFSAVLNSLILAKCITAHLWENSAYVSKQLKGIGPTFSTLLATAGKINFMLLEESHPRDLERIMNKGAPAGNVIRKQIALLPKYQITMTPINERLVSVQLLLLNHSYLSENMDHLTAGETHKSFILAGDSENYVLLLTSFKDKDLIGIYDGCITHELTRKHHFEHKVIVHCISSKFVGIDAQCEYLFKDLEQVTEPRNASTKLFSVYEHSPLKKAEKKQTCITDTFKVRKRRNSDVNITQSKEKKKRLNALSEKIRILKQSFGKASKELNEDIHNSNLITQNINCDVNQRSENTFTQMNSFEAFEPDIFVDDIEINNILKEIEIEQSESNYSEEAKMLMEKNKLPVPQDSECKSSCKQIYTKLLWEKAQTKPRINKSNYNFIDSLDRNYLSDEEQSITHQKDNSFSETIKEHVNMYFQETGLFSKIPSASITNLIEYNSSSNDDKGYDKIGNLPVIDLNPSKLINTDINNKDSVIEVSKQLISASTIDNKNDNKEKSASENFDGLYSLSYKITDKFNTLNAQDENDDPISKENDVTEHENLVVLRPKKIITNVTICDQDNDYTRDTISQNVIEYSKCQRIETLDRPVPFLPIVPFKLNNSVVENGVDAKVRNDKIHHNIFCDQTTDIKSTEIEKPCDNDVTQITPTMILASEIPVSDIDNVDDLKENQRKVIFVSNIKSTNTSNNLNEHMSTIGNIVTRKEYINSNRDSYKKKYCYKATNVDISTHNTEEHQIRVIKRLKIDLDITEIVTQNNVQEHKADSQGFRNPVSLHNLYPNKVFAINSNPKNIKFSDSETEIQPVKYISTDEIDNCERSFHKSSKYSKNYKQRWLDDNSFKNNESNVTSIGYGNKVLNILHKYSEVLRKNIDNGTSNINIEPKIKYSENESNPKIEKKNRPFNITDIHKVNIKLSLPTLNSETFKHVHQCTETHTVKEDKGESHTIYTINDKDNCMTQNDCELNDMPDISEFMSPVSTSDLNVDDLNLDQSMFDPRTVLQCLSYDTAEIIPPPAQFSDLDYSPSQSTYRERENELYSKNMCDVADFCESTLEDSNSDFIDDYMFNDSLPQSPDIETLILSQEYGTDIPVKESFAMMHKNLSAQSSSSRYRILSSRRPNLDKFKFISKNKFRK